MSDSLDVLLPKRFISRRDVKAVQHRDGSYTPEREKWKMSDVKSHLSGDRSLGHYLIGEDDSVKLFAFDIDLKKAGVWMNVTEEDKLLEGGQECNPREIWLTPDHPAKEYFTTLLRCMAEGLAMRAHRISGGAFPIAIAYSGNKGLHVYGFMGNVPAQEARDVAIEVLTSFNCFEPSRGNNFWVHTGDAGYAKNLEIEIFPKQGSLEGKELGNLMRLPLGVNAKSGQEAFFIDTRVGYNQLKKYDPMKALNGEYEWGN